MGINRPTNLNIRDVPGNGSIVGPSTSPSCVESTTTCESCTNSIGVCADYSLGSQYVFFCACACCDNVCACDCTVCDRTIPNGVWKTSEQYEAKERDAWGDDTSSSGAETCLCSINPGLTGCTCSTFTGGYVICKASSVAWVVAPVDSVVSRNWYSRADAVTVAQANTGCTGWFVPSLAQTINPGNVCKTYWSPGLSKYWSNDEGANVHRGTSFSFNHSRAFGTHFKGSSLNVRAFRCVSY